MLRPNAMRYRLAQVWQVLWGLPQTVVGLALWLGLSRERRRYSFRTAHVCEWGLRSGFTTGMFIFVPQRCPRGLLLHEYGHTLQSLILGPLYLPVIVLPSLVWAGLPQLARLRRTRHISYYSLYCERWANVLSRRVTGERPEGWYDAR